MAESDRRNCKRRWRPEDVTYIYKHIDAPNAVLAAKFGRTEGAIRALKYKLKQTEKKYDKIRNSGFATWWRN